jgi:uncharacterized protein
MTADRNQARLLAWIAADAERMAALAEAAALDLPDWCLAAGFVRNLAWDRLYRPGRTTPLNDLDLIYFDPDDSRPARDRELEMRLRSQSGRPWSVKNQARMHLRNQDPPYRSCADAMRYWPEIETAVGVRLGLADGELSLVAPFGVDALFAGTITLNPHRPKPAVFRQRLAEKRWLAHWPGLRLAGDEALTG